MNTAAALEALTDRDPHRIADRYDVQSLLGRGGMASAYRALDTVTGKWVALKQLSLDGDAEQRKRCVELFEREFLTLVQLAHPRVVEAHDYGVDDGRPYYTMELLDGGDLQSLAPMPWQQVCVVAYEICSALSLLHSRRLVHRDLTPRNIRRTADGKAKLIDFGLLSPMGPPGVIAGTPPFVPPELVNSLPLDGRSDLFSLGATLYFALTGSLAYPARRLERLHDVWRTSPAAPSKLVEGIPTGLDELVLAMLRIDAGSRPKSAAEVMDRLLPLLDRAPDEELKVVSAYLTVPRLVGRDNVIVRFRGRILRAVRRRGGGFVVSGEAGSGRTRMLDAFILEAKLAGATAIRASATNATRPFGVAAALARQLHDSAPAASLLAARTDPKVHAMLFGPQGITASTPPSSETPSETLTDVTRPELDRVALLAALRAWLLEFANRRPLAIAVDDVDAADEPSAALLASLTWGAPKHRLAYAVSVEAEARSTAPTALGVIRKHAALIELSPLGLDETTLLLRSVFGDTANLQLLSKRLHALCGGSPRECMTLTQFLVGQGAITYGGGSWTLPGEIPEGLLPASIEEAIERRVSELEPMARRFAAFLALGLTDRLSRTQLMQLEGVSPAAVDAATHDLFDVRLLTGDASGYALRHGTAARVLTSTLSEDEGTEIHQKLAEMHERSDAHPLLVAYHKLNGTSPEAGLDGLSKLTSDSELRTRFSITASAQLGADRTGRAIERALREAVRLRRPSRELQAFWVMLAGVSAQGEDAGHYYRLPPEWLEQLKSDTGWNEWQTLDPSLDPMTRAMMALGAASQRYYGAPEEERVLAPPDAIKQLVSYVIFSISVSARVLDLKLMASLPALLVPFAPLNPMVAATLDNARGTLLNHLGNREAAREIFLGVLRQLDAVTGAELAYVDRVRGAIFQTLAEIDASLGVKSFWVARLDAEKQDSYQMVGVRYLKKVAALHQGNWEEAEKYRQQAELLTLQSESHSMFSTLGQELEAHAMARDLTGLKQVRAGIHAMAEQHPGWVPVKHVSDAHYLRLCGDLEGALAAARAGFAVGAPSSVRSPWTVQARTVESELLTELGRAEEALSLGNEALSECERDGMSHLARGLSHAVALAEAKLGRFERSSSRIRGLIADQIALGVTGLQLGRSYELAARVAILASDISRFREYSALTAEHYHPGRSSVLGALYERLMEEARQAGVNDVPSIAPAPLTEEALSEMSLTRVTTAMTGCSDRDERARRVLSLLCDGDPPGRGHLFFITETGLELVASSVPDDDISEVTAYAQRRVDLEIEESSTLTAMVAPGGEAAQLDGGPWQSIRGTRYDAALLAIPLDDGVRVAGIAVLTGDGGWRTHSFGRLTAAVARTVLASGDALGVAVE